MNTYPNHPQPVDLLTEENDIIFLDAASNWQRLANWIIDILAFYIAVFIIFVGVGIVLELNGTLETIDDSSDTFYNLVFIVGYVSFMTCLETLTKGRSVGKWITKTKVVTADGYAITFSHAFLRSLVRMVPFELISVFFAGVPWHDKWTKTQVIKKTRRAW